MKIFALLPRRCQSFHVPFACLLALLQRTPVVRVAILAEEFVLSSPVGTVLKSATALLGTLGAVHSLAGATEYSFSPSSDVSGTVGKPISPLAFTIIGSPTPPNSFSVTGLPPGLSSSGGGSPVISGTPTKAGDYSVSVDGTDGTYSLGATITFHIVDGDATAPSFTTSPANQTVNAGTTVQFTVVASGSPAPTFQWRKNGTAIAGATSASLSLPNAQTSDAGSYSCVATNSAGAATSSAATLTVNAGTTNVAPTFTTQPASQTLTAGATAQFTVAVSGTPNPTLQWQKNSAAIAGATSATLSLPNVQTSDAASYTCVATNTAGSATSNAVTLTVNASGAPAAPAFTLQPASKTIANGSTVVFTATASGSPAPTFQWRKDGTAITGATSSTLVLAAATAAQAGSYTCVATSSAGIATSTPALLTVSSTPDFGRIINLSVLTSLSSSESLFTVGTVIGGPGTSGSKPLIIRAGGPALTPIGVGGVLPDPKLDLFSGQTVIDSNDNWGGGPVLTNAFASVGAFDFSPTSKDAAISRTLASGSYTVQVKDSGGASGTVIAELYDASPAGSFSSTAPRLINVSLLKQIDSGAILTVGFVIGGSTAKTLLVRVVGPTLAATFNVGSAMPDPKLDLFSGQTVIATNDNWGGDPQLAAAGGSVGAFDFATATSKDAMLLITLAPGAYTVQASGVSGSSGIALIEVYDIP